MPLADEPGLVSGRPHDDWKCLQPVTGPIPGHVVDDAVARRILSGEKAGTIRESPVPPEWRRRASTRQTYPARSLRGTPSLPFESPHDAAQFRKAFEPADIGVARIDTAVFELVTQRVTMIRSHRNF